MDIQKACDAFRCLLEEQLHRAQNMNQEKTDFSQKESITIGLIDGDGIGPVIMSQAVRVLEKNIDKSLTVSELAALCRMSEINLKKLFSRYAGVGVIAYFNRLKMTRAVAMLKSGMSAKETAAALGFANQNYFSTVFKRIHGVPPSFYK